MAVSYSSSAGGRSTYLGKDVLGSVKTATTDTGAVADRYEYDAFGTPYSGDLSGGMNLGYLGKPYDTATGLYNYGFRDYSPQAARFTTVDPVRDGNNWFAYVNNDPVNWVDLWGLRTGDPKYTTVGPDANNNYTTTIRNERGDIVVTYVIDDEIQFTFKDNNYGKVFWRGETSTLASAMYEEAKKIDPEYLSERTIDGIAMETFVHWIFSGISERAETANIGGTDRDKLGYDPNAWVFEIGRR